jgi:threonine dehydratase
VRHAQERIAGSVHHTPVFTCRSLNELAGATLYFKCENFQRSGAFKARGAFNAVLSLSAAQARRGVATHSSGNHGAALALAASHRHVPCHVVVPVSIPAIKRAAVEREGATIVECAATLTAREAALADVLDRTGACYIAPFDNPAVIAGQGTVALELFDEVSDLDQIWVPVGGGGLASGVATVASSVGVDVVGAEPENADDAFRSLQTGVRQPMEAPDTIADGLRTSLSPLTFDMIERNRVRIRLASEAGIRRAQRLLFERLKVVVEPSAAVPLAALLENPEMGTGRKVGIVLSGGNVDLAGAFE